MRLHWAEEALEELEAIGNRAPNAAGEIVDSVEQLVESPFPQRFRRLRDRPDQHILSRAPYVVFYVVDGDQLTVVAVEDARRRREPW